MNREQRAALIDQYLDTLAHDPDAKLPPEFDAQLNHDLPRWVEAQRPVHLSHALRQRMWARALDAATRSSSPNGAPPDITQSQEEPMTSFAVPAALRRKHTNLTGWMLIAAAMALIALGTLLVVRPPEVPMMVSSQIATVMPTSLPVINQEMTVEIGGHLNGLDHHASEFMRQAGMNWIKWELPFSIHEVERGVSRARTYIEWARLRNLRVLLTLVGDPIEMAGSPTEMVESAMARYRSQFTEFATQVAALGVDALEIWTEPNLDRHWLRGSISGESYLALLRLVYGSVKAVAPDTLVISAGPAPTQAGDAFPEQVLNDDEWLRQFVTAGGLDYADCIGMHYIEGIVSPSQRSGDPRDDSYTRYFSSMIERYLMVTGNDTPFCFTEFGYLSGEGLAPLPASFAWAAETTVGEQAQWLLDAVALANLEYSHKIKLMIVWNVNYTSDDDSPMAGYAIIRPDGRCPACEQLRTLWVTNSEASAVLRPFDPYDRRFIPNEGEGWFVISGSVAGYEGPSEDYEVIRRVQDGEFLRVTAISPDGEWLSVQAQQQVMWLATAQLDIRSNDESVAITEDSFTVHNLSAHGFPAEILCRIRYAETYPLELRTSAGWNSFAITFQLSTPLDIEFDVHWITNIDDERWYYVETTVNDLQYLGWLPAERSEPIGDACT